VRGRSRSQTSDLDGRPERGSYPIWNLTSHSRSTRAGRWSLSCFGAPRGSSHRHEDRQGGGKPPSCSDADDVFFDAKRRRIYVSCGEGVVDVFQTDSASTRRLASVHTSAGARTSVFVPELDRLFVAVRAGPLHSEASILMFRPAP